MPTRNAPPADAPNVTVDADVPEAAVVIPTDPQPASPTSTAKRDKDLDPPKEHGPHYRG